MSKRPPELLVFNPYEWRTDVQETIRAHATFVPLFENFRFFPDLPSVYTLHALAGVNTNITLSTATRTCVLACMLSETGGLAGAGTDVWQLQYSKNSGAYTNVTASSSNVKVTPTASGLEGTFYASSLSNVEIGGSGATGDDGQGCSFTIGGSSYSPTKIAVASAPGAGSPTDDLTLSIHTALNGGTEVFSHTFSSGEFDASNFWWEVDCSVTFSASTTYYVRLEKSTTTGGEVYRAYKTNTSADLNSIMEATVDASGTWAADTGKDLLFGMKTDSDAWREDGGINHLNPSLGTSSSTLGVVSNGHFHETGDGAYTLALTGDRWSSIEYHIQLVEADLADGDTLDFRITLNGGTPGFTNSVTPRITVSKPVTYSATPGAGSAAITGYAPTVDLAETYEATPGAGSATITGYAPTVSPGYTASIPAGSVDTTGFAPSLTEDIAVSVPAGSAAVTGNAPTVTEDISVSIGAGSATITGYAPTAALQTNHDVTPDTGAATITGAAPTVTEDIAVSVPAGSATITGQAPSVTDQVAVSIPAGSATITGYAPTTALQTNAEATPGVGSATITGYAPTTNLTDAYSVTPDTGSITTTGFAPTVSLIEAFEATPDAGSATITGFAPVASVTAAGEVSPPVGSVTVTGHAPTVTEDIGVSVGAGAASITGSAPTVTEDINVSPEAGASNVVGFAPTVALEAAGSVSPGTGSITVTGYAPTVGVIDNVVVFPDRGIGTFTGHAPTVVNSGDVVVPDKPAGGGRGRGPKDDRRKPVIFNGRMYDPVRDRAALAAAVQEFLDSSVEEEVVEVAEKPVVKTVRRPKIKSGDVEITAPATIPQEIEYVDLKAALEALDFRRRQVNRFIAQLKAIEEDEEEAIMVLLMAV